MSRRPAATFGSADLALEAGSLEIWFAPVCMLGRTVQVTLVIFGDHLTDEDASHHVRPHIALWGELSDGTWVECEFEGGGGSGSGRDRGHVWGIQFARPPTDPVALRLDIDYRDHRASLPLGRVDPPVSREITPSDVV
jgi:hypothetical protein